MRMIDKAWRKMSETTIFNCFKKAGFPANSTTEPENELPSVDMPDWDQMVTHLKINGPNVISIENFVSFDDNLSVSGVFIDDDIVEEVCGQTHDAEKTTDEDVNEPEPAPNRQEVQNALNVLRCFTEFSPQATVAEFNRLHNLEMFFEYSAYNLTQLLSLEFSI
ncbi:hypothetical protein PGB90_004336 [Kerria lacca]